MSQNLSSAAIVIGVLRVNYPVQAKNLNFNPSAESLQGFIQQFWEKAPGQNWEKMID